MAEQAKTKITEDDLLAYGEDVRVEVVNGEIVVEMSPNRIDHSIYGQQLATYLNVFVRAKSIGRVGGDMGIFKLKGDEAQGIKGARVPDVFFISYERLPRDADINIVPDFSPDLAVEVISESEKYEDVIAKIDDYLEHGTKQVWIVLPQVREVRGFTPDNRTGVIFKATDDLTGGDLLPGFAVPVRAIFDHGDPALHIETLRRLMEG